MKVAAILPARMAASRFPGKPLAKICGISMIEHVRRRACMCSHFSDVIVATCDQEIIDEVSSHGGKAVMTSDKHVRCTDRIAEAAEHVDADVVVNIQGDEPLIHPDMFHDLLEPFFTDNGQIDPEQMDSLVASWHQDQALACSNLMGVVESDEDFRSPNLVKVVCDLEGNALYMSREPIPTNIYDTKRTRHFQLGIIAFRKDFLLEFTHLPPTPLEQTESVDMMRAIEHGRKVRMIETSFKSIGVDTPEDLARAEELMKADELFTKYSS